MNKKLIPIFILIGVVIVTIVLYFVFKTAKEPVNEENANTNKTVYLPTKASSFDELYDETVKNSAVTKSPAATDKPILSTFAKEVSKNITSNTLINYGYSDSCQDKIKYLYNRAILENVNSGFLETQDYVYTDKVVNPATKDVYMRRKISNEGCGRNGSWVCDLVVERKNGQKEFVADLLFPYCFSGQDDGLNASIKNGAKLLEFSDKDNLLIEFGVLDHCINESSVLSYNLVSKKLSGNILSFSVSDTNCDNTKNYTSYELCSADFCLEFTDKISLKKEGEITAVTNNIKIPYEVEFDIEKNYKNPNFVNLKINSKTYSFDFTTQQLELKN